MSKQTILILEGQDTEDYADLDLHLPDEKYSIKMLSNLYEYPDQILTLGLIDPDYILIQTTGMYHEKIKHLIELFEQSKYKPKNIIFGSRMSFDIMCTFAYECIDNFGTRIYESNDDILIEYEWMYENCDVHPNDFNEKTETTKKVSE